MAKYLESVYDVSCAPNRNVVNKSSEYGRASLTLTHLEMALSAMQNEDPMTYGRVSLVLVPIRRQAWILSTR